MTLQKLNEEVEAAKTREKPAAFQVAQDVFPIVVEVGGQKFQIGNVMIHVSLTEHEEFVVTHQFVQASQPSTAG